MGALLRIQFLFNVLRFVAMEKTSGYVFTGTVGGSVDIHCHYPDGYIYVPKYFYRHPDKILIKSALPDKLVSKTRYSILDTPSSRTISVIIKDLVFKDSGDYYCGVEKWGFDISIKVKIIVKKGRTPESTDLPWSSTVIPVAESTLHEQMSSTLDAQFSNKISKWPIFSDYSSYELQLMIAGLISLLLLSVVVGLVVFYWGRLNSNSTSLKSSGPENPNLDPPAPIKMEDGDHMYDEILGVYSLAGPVKEEDTSTTSCTIQYLHTAREDCSPYSLIAPH